MKKVIENTAYFAIAVVVIWLIGKGCSSVNKDVGEYVYIQPIGGTALATLHTDRDCSELDDALYMTPKEAFEAGFYRITFCTECVTDKQYKQLQKYQKQP